MKFTATEIYDLMRTQFIASRMKLKTRAIDPIQFCGFQPEDVALVHYPKLGPASGSLRFSLKDGRVVDLLGNACNPDPALYQVETVAV